MKSKGAQFWGEGYFEKSLWILIAFIDYTTRLSFTPPIRPKRITYPRYHQPQTTLANHSFIESLTSSGAAWVTILKYIYNISNHLSINYTISIHKCVVVVKSFFKNKKNNIMYIIRLIK